MSESDEYMRGYKAAVSGADRDATPDTEEFVRGWNDGAREQWDWIRRQREAEMKRKGLVWCPVCDGDMCHPDDDRACRGDVCPACNGDGTVAAERVEAVELH